MISTMDEPESQFSACVEALRAGGVVVHATEGVFGLACNIRFKASVDRITALKGRNPNANPYLILVGNMRQVTELVSLDIPNAAAIKTSWPAAITWVFPEKTVDYEWVGSEAGSLGVRFTAHPQAQQLAALAGPLISTSANPHGAPAALEIAAAQQYFSDKVDFYLDGQLQNPGHPSQIRDALSGKRLR